MGAASPGDRVEPPVRGVPSSAPDGAGSSSTSPCGSSSTSARGSSRYGHSTTLGPDRTPGRQDLDAVARTHSWRNYVDQMAEIGIHVEFGVPIDHLVAHWIERRWEQEARRR